jgi:hypothetical protein
MPLLDLATVTHETFSALAGQAFQVSKPQVFVSLELAECRPLGSRRSEGSRLPFSLTFRGAPGLRLPQGIHRFESAQTGAFEIFITQIADGPAGSEFEAIFN